MGNPRYRELGRSKGQPSPQLTQLAMRSREHRASVPEGSVLPSPDPCPSVWTTKPEEAWPTFRLSSSHSGGDAGDGEPLLLRRAGALGKRPGKGV